MRADKPPPSNPAVQISLKSKIDSTNSLFLYAESIQKSALAHQSACLFIPISTFKYFTKKIWTESLPLCFAYSYLFSRYL